MKKTKSVNLLVLLITVISIIASFTIGYIVTDIKAVLIISQSIILIPAIIYVILTKQNIFKLIRFKKVGILTVILIVVFTYLMMPILSLINTISMLFSTNIIKDVASSVVGDNLLIGLFMIAFIPAVVEETTYRGILYNTYKTSSPMKAMLLSALVFGAIHMNFNQFFYAAFLGIVMAMLLEATDSIVSSMIMHFVFNGNSVVLMYLMPKLEKIMATTEGIEMPSTELTRESLIMSILVLTPIAIATTAGAVGIFVLIANINKRLDYIKSLFKRQRIKQKKERIGDIFLVLAILICAGFALYTELKVRNIL